MRCIITVYCYSDTYVKLIFNINALDGINKKSFTRAVYGETYQYKIDDKVEFYTTLFTVLLNYFFTILVDINSSYHTDCYEHMLYD